MEQSKLEKRIDTLIKYRSLLANLEEEKKTVYLKLMQSIPFKVFLYDVLEKYVKEHSKLEKVARTDAEYYQSRGFISTIDWMFDKIENTLEGN